MSRTITDEQLVALLRDANPAPSISRGVLTPRQQRLLERVLTSDPGESPGTFLPRARRRRVLLGVTSTGGVAAAATAAALIFTAGGSPSVAFAGWTSGPTTPASGQVPAAESECGENPALASLRPTLADTRGPYTLLVYGQSSGGVCIAGPSFAGYKGAPPLVPLQPPVALPGGAQRSLTTPVAPNGVQRILVGLSIRNPREPGATYRYNVGRVGVNVTAVTLTLQDGSKVQASTDNGWFAAWWPAGQENQTAAQSAEITATDGTSTQQLVPPAGSEAGGSQG